MKTSRSSQLMMAAVALIAMFALTSCGPRQQVVDAAVSQIGVPYSYGGDSPEEGFDCSGLTSWAWSRANVSIPRTSAAQYAATERISKSELRPGDLVFWGSSGRVHHVAMFVGDGQVVHARKPGTRVEYESVDWWASNRIGYGRVEA